MRQQHSWNHIIPVEETRSAANFLVCTWDKIASAVNSEIQYKKHEPKLTELLYIYLNLFKAQSGLTGFWVNEAQEPQFDSDNKIRRIKKDITYYSNASKVSLELIFEFKKLSRSSLATYRGKDGMRRFVDGNYAPEKPLAVMVGITDGDCKDVLSSLSNSLSKASVQKDLQMVHDASGRYLRDPSEVISTIAKFDTEHRRPALKAPPNGTTTLAHIILQCRK